MIAISKLKKGVELCLNNGKRLLDDAKFLQNNKRFASAIPLYVISYEELNKGLFLEDHLFINSDTDRPDAFAYSVIALNSAADTLVDNVGIYICLHLFTNKL